MNLVSIIPGIVCGNDTYNDILMSFGQRKNRTGTVHSSDTEPVTAPRRCRAVQQKGEWQCFRLRDTNSAHALKHAAAVGSADCRFYMNKKGNGTG